jgi:hypothetical protein
MIRALMATMTGSAGITRMSVWFVGFVAYTIVDVMKQRSEFPVIGQLWPACKQIAIILAWLILFAVLCGIVWLVLSNLRT